MTREERDELCLTYAALLGARIMPERAAARNYWSAWVGETKVTWGFTAARAAQDFLRRRGYTVTADGQLIGPYEAVKHR